MKNRDSNDPAFKTWKNTVERYLNRVFGDNCPELKHFHKLRFFYRASVMTLGKDYTYEHRECFDRDFEILKSSINNYIEELKQDQEDEVEDIDTIAETTKSVQRIFISHSFHDINFVEGLIELLELIGVQSESIFCTSFGEYGIGLGENFLNAIKDELHNDTLVLFLLSEYFYESPVCLCEMGATWVLTKDHIPILVPPLDFSDVKGVIPQTQGFKINDKLKLNQFKESIESKLGLSSNLNHSTWERKRDRIIERINENIK